jgi:hypothetical protein
MASANWDGLVEAAVGGLTGNAKQHLNVVALKEDLRGTDVPIELLKSARQVGLMLL